MNGKIRLFGFLVVISFCALLSSCLESDRILTFKFSPDGRYVAYLSEKGGLQLFDIEDGSSVELDKENIKGENVSWSPDSKKIVYVSSVEGSWDIMIGGMFDDIWDKNKHILEPFNIPRSWKVYRAFDWGQSKPFSVGWWAISDGTYALVHGKKVLYPRGTMIRVGEWYGCTKKPNEGIRMTNIQLGRGIKKRETQLKRDLDISKILKGPADASIFGDESDAESIASKISKSYYNKNTKAKIFVPSNKSSGTRIIGWQLMRDRLEAVVNNDIETSQMYVFNTNRDFIRTIREQQRDDKNPDDIDTDGEDHIADETRYMCLFASNKSDIKRYTIA